MKRLGFLPLFLLFAAAPSARAETPMDYLWTHGPSADPVTRLNWGLIVISVVVVVIIAALVLYGCLRRRPPPATGFDADLPGRMAVEPDTGAAISWVYIGVGISTVVLLGSTAWTLGVLSAVAAPSKPTVTAEITAHQWWWEVRYGGPNPQEMFITANEIHIPVGEPVHLKLESDDVIHSFWVPKLGGKTDVIPGQTNYTWLQADKPGEYRGQCGEFCGPQHAHMALYVIAEERPKFEAWRQQQLRSSATLPAPSQQALHGRDVFLGHCAVCHTVKGTPAGGRLGPDLTHLMSRQTIGSGTLPNTTGALNGWVADAQGIKPGARMPAMNLTPQELHAVVDYLQTLQ